MISLEDLNPAKPRDLPAPRIFRARPGTEETAQARLAFLIQPITSILAVVFLLIAGYGSWSESSQALLQRLAAGNAFVFLLMRLMIGHFGWPKRNPHVSATAAVGVAVSYAMITIWISGALWPTIYLAFAIVFTGFLYASRGWLYFNSILICTVWGWLSFPQIQAEGWSTMAGALGGAIVSAGCFFELRRKNLGDESEAAFSPLDAALGGKPDVISVGRTVDRVAPWCPVCKASADAVIRHNGEMVVDANSSATELLGLSVAEMAALPLVGLFPIEKRDSLKPILRLGNFEPFETLASGFKDECIPVRILNSGRAGDNSGLQALVMRDLRETEKLRLSAAAANRRSQQAFCRDRELAGLARKHSRQTVEDKLKSLAQTVHRWLPCSVGCFVVLWDNASEQFSVAASSAAHPLKIDALLAEDAPLIAWLSENGEALVVPKVGSDEFRVRSLYSLEPVNAFCAFPLMTEDGMMGFLLVFDRNHREFASEEIDYLTIIAQFATNVCDRAMLEERLNGVDPYENKR